MMKKMNMVVLATVVLTAFAACNPNNPKKSTAIEGQWVKSEGEVTYMDINHQIPNTFLKGEMDDDLKAPFARFEQTIQSTQYSDNNTTCVITLSNGDSYTFTNITASSCVYQDGDLPTPYVRPSSPFAFKTEHDKDTINPVAWNTLFYVNDTLLSFFDYQVVDETNTTTKTYPATIENMDCNGRDSVIWNALKRKQLKIDSTQVKVIVANPSIKAEKHRFYLLLTRNTTPTTGLTSASLLYGCNAFTTVANVFPSSVTPKCGYYYTTPAVSVDSLFNKVLDLTKSQKMIFEFVKFK